MIYLQLFFIFAKIGVFGFGGGMAMLPMIYQGVQQFGLMSYDEFSNLVAISQVTPGPIAVNAATYVGYNSAGVLGAVCATLGVALPSFLLVTLVSYFIEKFNENNTIKGAFNGIRPATVGLLGSAVILMGQTVFVSTNIIPFLIFGMTILLVWKFKISPIVIVFIMGIIGALLCG
ncbi:MAG: chromate transporter [Eubacteriales bacterium]|nr:chromate transporter [Eubacteriales bacterium]